MLKRGLRLCCHHRNTLLRGGPTKHTTDQLQMCPRRGNLRCFTANTAPKKWDLFSAVCLERHPIITRPMKDIEVKVRDMFQQREFEGSMKSDHEVRLEEEMKYFASANLDNEGQKSDKSAQLARDFEDKNREELRRFKFAERFPEKEGTTDTSLRRKLDKHLVLITEQKFGKDLYWVPPQSIRKDGETMRQAAERTLRESCGEKVAVKFYGNAPIGYYKYKYPKGVCNDEHYGAKVFFFLAKYIDGTVSSDTKHRWLTREELREALPTRVSKCVFQFLLPE